MVSYGECPLVSGGAAGPDDDQSVVTCQMHQWTCGDGTCINLKDQCNGVRDCAEGEDEMFCEAEEGGGNGNNGGDHSESLN